MVTLWYRAPELLCRAKERREETLCLDLLVEFLGTAQRGGSDSGSASGSAQGHSQGVTATAWARHLDILESAELPSHPLRDLQGPYRPTLSAMMSLCVALGVAGVAP